MLEGARDYAIIFLELDGRIASWNKGAERIKGYRAEEIVGQQNLFSNAIKFRRREEAPRIHVSAARQRPPVAAANPSRGATFQFTLPSAGEEVPVRATGA